MHGGGWPWLAPWRPCLGWLRLIARLALAVLFPCLALALPCAAFLGLSCCLPSLAYKRPFLGLSACLPCYCLAGSLIALKKALSGPWLACLLHTYGGPAFGPCWLPCWPIKIVPCLACRLASCFLPYGFRLGLLAGFLLPIKIGGGLLACFRLACQ